MGEEQDCRRARKVEDITAAHCKDYAGLKIVCLYMYNPPDYAVYRTPSRVMIQFADLKQTAREQRKALRCLTPLRGQINGLIDGWHDPAPEDSRWPNWGKKRQAELYKSAVRYDRRVADALVTALEGDVAHARALLTEVKNDIINERTSMARTRYMCLALGLVTAILVLMGLVSASWFDRIHQFSPSMEAVWSAISGGAIGAFFSIAVGLKGRTILIDFRNRENASDAILRILIGGISGGLILCLLRSGIVNGVVKAETLDPSNPDSYSDLLVFVIGFIAGFFERLVPNLLTQTNLGTTETATKGTAVGGRLQPPFDGPSSDNSEEETEETEDERRPDTLDGTPLGDSETETIEASQMPARETKSPPPLPGGSA